jgi:hypothetical protein
MPKPTYQLEGQSKKMAAKRLSFGQRKIIWNWYWKVENMCEIQRKWRREFASEPPTRLKTASIRDKFEADGGRPER